jgi:hypothetical protein
VPLLGGVFSVSHEAKVLPWNRNSAPPKAAKNKQGKAAVNEVVHASNKVFSILFEYFPKTPV